MLTSANEVCLMKENISDFNWKDNERILVSTEGDVELLRKKPKVDRMLELENKILKIYSIVNTLSWFLVFNYIVTSIMFISLVAKGF